MFSGVGVVCFAASFGLVFLAEIIRLRVKSTALQGVSLTILILGMIAQTTYLTHHFIFKNEHLVVSVGGWFFVLAWGLAILTLYLMVSRPKTPFSLFLLPAVFLSIGVGAAFSGVNFPEAATGRTIRALHGLTLLATTVFVFFGFVTGILYLVHSAKLKRPGRFLAGISLPSLEWLQKANRRLVKLSAVFLGIGILSGFYLRHVLPAEGILTEKLWSGPVYNPDLMVLGAIFLFLFLMAVLLTFRQGDARNDRRMARVTIACFLILAAILLVGIAGPRAHWRSSAGTKPSTGSPNSSETSERGTP